MIGNYIKGTDIHGTTCEGVILDKILCMQTIIMPPAHGQLGKGQVMPIPLEAYLIIGNGDSEVHLVNPEYISELAIPSGRSDTAEVIADLTKEQKASTAFFAAAALPGIMASCKHLDELDQIKIAIGIGASMAANIPE